MDWFREWRRRIRSVRGPDGTGRLTRLVVCCASTLVILPTALSVGAGASASPASLSSISARSVNTPPVAPAAWEVSDRVIPSLTPNAVACPSANICYATGSGSDSGILATTDGGASWTSQPVPPGTVNLTSISCPTISTCLAGGGHGGSGNASFLIATYDSGATWVSLEAPGVYDVTGLACPSALICYAAMSGPGAVLSTTDGGATWTDTSLPGSWDLTGIACPTVTDCHIVGSDPNGAASVSVTTDRGATWVNQPLPPHGANYDQFERHLLPDRARLHRHQHGRWSSGDHRWRDYVDVPIAPCRGRYSLGDLLSDHRGVLRHQRRQCLNQHRLDHRLRQDMGAVVQLHLLVIVPRYRLSDSLRLHRRRPTGDDDHDRRRNHVEDHQSAHWLE